MKISYLILLSFLFILLLFSITTLINYNQYNEVQEKTDFLARSATIVREGNRYHRNILNLVGVGRGYLLTKDKSLYETFQSTTYENDSIFKEINTLLDDARQQDRLAAIRELDHKWVKEYSALFADIIRRKITGKLKADTVRLNKDIAELSGESPVFKRLQADLRSFINEEYARREVQKEILTDSIRSTRRISFWLTLISIIGGFLIAGTLAYNLSKRILKMVGMARTISSGNYVVHMKDNKNDELSHLSTSLNNMAEVLAENFALLKRKNEELDQFAHIVSHDLKAPLRGIGNVVSWIEEDHGNELPPKVHEYLQLIHGRLIRAENLIKGILSYARTGTESNEIEHVKVHDLVTEIVEAQTSDPGISIEIDRHLPNLLTQKIPLFQVFSNLVNNAIKYHDKKNGRVLIYSKEYPSYYEFFVEDDGPGIAAGHQAKIFKIFQTLRERDTFESTGVGLAIVQKIIDARKEQIKLNSKPGRGSIFSFTWKK
ncbi:sensor histidine kinase [Flavitalea sp.]|nr:ATP-binding protein [Flavitalea sp.]